MIENFWRATLLAVCLSWPLSQAEAQSYPAPSSGQLLAEAVIYTEEHIGGSFQSFVGRYAPSVDLEAAIWDLTANSETLARLADLFGWSDPWKYRRAADGHTESQRD